MLMKLKANAVDSRILMLGCIHTAKVYIEYKVRGVHNLT